MRTIRTTALLAAIAVSTSLAVAEAPVSSSLLPDSPGFMMGAGQSGQPAPTSLPTSGLAPKYASIITPDEQAQTLNDGDKTLFAFRELLSPLNLASGAASAGWSHLIDSAPHYGSNSSAFAQRFGASMARQGTQAVFTDGVFAPLFHDDPRYYVMGREKPFVRRVLYAASRVVVTKSNSGNSRFNAPLFAGYGVAAAMNNLYYPEVDRTVSRSVSGYATSLVGAAVGFEVEEFLGDALRIVHLKKN